MPRLSDANPIILGEAIKQLHARLQHAVPAIPLGVVKTGFAVPGPPAVQHRGGILPLEIGSYGLLERPAKQHGRPGVFLFPAIEVAMLVATRAGQILADLGIAVGHEETSAVLGSLSTKPESSPHRVAGAKPSKLRTDMPCTVTSLTLTTPHRSTNAFSSISFLSNNSAS